MSKTPEVLVLNIEEIRENPVALRTVNVEGEGFIGLRDSIGAIGITNAISVRRQTEEIDGKTVTFYELLDGLHRYTAAKMCGIKEIPVVVKSMDKAQALEAQLMTNLHVVATKPAEYAAQLQRVFSANPTLTLGQMSAKICKGKSWINQRLDLLKLEDAIQKIVDESGMTVANAHALSKLPPDEQPNFLEQACGMQADEFVPLAAARAKEIKDEARKGKQAGPAKFVPIPKCQKMPILKEELAKNSVGPGLCKRLKVKTAADGFALAVAWVLNMDPITVEQRVAAENERRQKLDDAKKARAAERAKKKAEKAQQDAIKAEEAISTK